MAISSYPRTIQNGQIAGNGNQNAGTGLMLYNPTTFRYEAATVTTFNNIAAGAATVAKQDTQIARQDTQIAKQDTQIVRQDTQIANFTASTNGGILADYLVKKILTVLSAPLDVIQCKSVTLINLSTNNNIFYKTDDFMYNEEMILEPGYSVKINIDNSVGISVRQATDLGQILQYIVTW
jgi:hypothetical protein